MLQAVNAIVIENTFKFRNKNRMYLDLKLKFV